jgi:hypothetical protein
MENVRPVTDTKINLEDNNLKFDKNHKISFRYPPGYFIENKEYNYVNKKKTD